jgi:hypothetical protein
VSEDNRVSFAEWIASQPFGQPVDDVTALMLERAWEAAISRGLSGEEALHRARGEVSLWDAYLSDPAALLPGEQRRLDAAAEIVFRHFGLKHGWWIRARESARSAQVGHIIAALVLGRREWQEPPEDP